MSEDNRPITTSSRSLGKVLPEAAILGLILIVFVLLFSFIISGGSHPDFSEGIFGKYNPQMYASLFLAGGALHLLFEYMGWNAMFCKMASYY